MYTKNFDRKALMALFIMVSMVRGSTDMHMVHICLHHAHRLSNNIVISHFNLENRGVYDTMEKYKWDKNLFFK